MALKMAHEEFYTVILRLLIRYNTVISLFFFYVVIVSMALHP